MKPGDKNKPLISSLKDQQRKFNDVLREKEAAAMARAARREREDRARKEREDQARIGYKMPDGTIHAGVSPDTAKKMYAMPTDAPLTFTFKEAQKYAEGVNARKQFGHNDWRVPTKNELNVLFNNRAAIGGFDVGGSGPACWYWSATPNNGWNMWCQRFSDGYQNDYSEDFDLSVRLVRTEAPKIT
jgi:hypothetical protein